MASIYKNSTVAIVVASAQKVTDGFLSNGMSETPTAQLPLFINNSTSGTVYLRPRDRHMTYASDEPIFQRAWAFQELLLSPRALVFDSYQINYKCLEHRFQSVPETYLEFDFDCVDLPVSVFGLEDKNLAKRENTNREWYLEHTQRYTWTRIIQEYSERDISLFEDRLPALAGIAAELANSWNDTYVAGFWHRTIVRHLGWYRRAPTWRSGTPKGIFESVGCTRRIGSPSWSWATVPYAVHVDDMNSPDAQLLNSDVKPRSQKSPLGEVKEATIVLEARVLIMSSLALKFECWPFSSRSDNILLDFEHPKPNVECCRLVYLGPGFGGDSGRFLVVEKSTDGEFRRVGYAELSRWTEEWKNLLTLTKREKIAIK